MSWGTGVSLDALGQERTTETEREADGCGGVVFVAVGTSSEAGEIQLLLVVAGGHG